MSRAEYAPECLGEAARLIESGLADCVLMKGGAITDKASGIGVKPIIRFLEDKPGCLKGADVADKIVGKAAAMLLVFGGADYVYGGIMSESAKDYLDSRGVGNSCGDAGLIKMIKNRSGTGMCPLEQSVVGIEDPQEGYAAIKKTIERLMAESNK